MVKSYYIFLEKCMKTTLSSRERSLTTMKLYKIRTKYCSPDKVQIRFSNAPNQIITSKDGFSYLRQDDLNVHSYLSDSDRVNFPFSDHPTSNTSIAHLFKHHQFYVNFAIQPNIYYSLVTPSSSCYRLSFCFCHKTRKNKAYLAEFSLTDFSAKQEQFDFTKKELTEFLYSLEGFDAKYIFSWSDGILFAKAKNENCCIDRKFSLIAASPFCEDYPILILLKGDTMLIHEFEIIYHSQNSYTVKTKKRTIQMTPKLKIKCALSACFAHYTKEPSFAK